MPTPRLLIVALLSSATAAPLLAQTPSNQPRPNVRTTARPVSPGGGEAAFKPIFGPPGRELGNSSMRLAQSLGSSSCGGACLVVGIPGGGRGGVQFDLGDLGDRTAAGPGAGPRPNPAATFDLGDLGDRTASDPRAGGVVVRAAVALPHGQRHSLVAGLNGRDLVSILCDIAHTQISLSSAIGSSFQYEIRENGRVVSSGQGRPGEPIPLGPASHSAALTPLQLQISGASPSMAIQHGSRLIVVRGAGAGFGAGGVRTLELRSEGVSEFAVLGVTRSR